MKHPFDNACPYGAQKRRARYARATGCLVQDDGGLWRGRLNGGETNNNEGEAMGPYCLCHLRNAPRTETNLETDSRGEVFNQG